MPDPVSIVSTEEKVGRLFFIGLPSTEITSETRDLLLEIRPGGVCLFSRNIHERRQTRDLLDEICELLGYVPLLSLDQEGGRVDRLRRLITPMPPPSELRDPDDALRLGLLIGETIRILGFNMDFAPVVDVADDGRSGLQNGLTGRTFPGSANDVIEFAGAFLQGLSEFGILGCLKHFPGLGGSRVDSHAELPVVDVTETEWRENDLLPFQRLLSSHSRLAVMVAHAAYSGLGLQETASNGKILPSSLNSSFVSTILRDELGFEGVAITDDLEMGAVMNEFGIGEACEMAVRAGEDMLAICASSDAIRMGFGTLTAAVNEGRISETILDGSVNRIEGLRTLGEARGAFDESRLAELSDEIESFKQELNDR